MTHPDTIVIGGGVNGLVAATLLAKAGRSVTLLERGDRVGGCVRMSDIAPGFRCPTLAHGATLHGGIIDSLGLRAHGLALRRPEVDACAPGLDGRGLVLWHDDARAAREIQAFSASDAGRYRTFLESFRRISGVIEALSASPPPSIDAPRAGDLIEALKSARRFRALGKTDAYRLLRWMPMAVADLVDEWFESEPLKAAVAAGGVLGSFLGPRSAGSSAVLLMLGAVEGRPVPAAWAGTASLPESLASAARAAGVDVRTGTDVARIIVHDENVSGVALADGDAIAASVVVSSADPKRTLRALVDPMDLTPDFVRRVTNIRAHGTLAKVNFAVDRLPQFAGLASRDVAEQTAALSGRIRLAQDVNAIERAFDAAKYGHFSDDPWIELTIPSILDPSLAPAGRHVVSAYVQYAPYSLRGTTWDAERDNVGKAAIEGIARYAPDFPASIVAREVITPLDLERTYGLTGGHIFHGELALDQLFVARPLLGSGYATPIRNLYLCGSGTHPGVGGLSGAHAVRAILKA